MTSTDKTTTLVAHIILCVILIIGIFKMPYGYYQFLRVFVIIGCLFILSTVANSEYKYISLVYVVLIIIFNPIFKLGFSKNEWKYVDGICALVMAVLFVFMKLNLKPKPKEWDFSSRKDTPKQKAIKERIKRKIQERRDAGESI
ncbi:MAG TPA: DUF6804 family protein [Pedobacter sp.]|uniref:DUF6804 family protein n=1 Tax=Pedobacter sp. TaxID=1411316 RepID=UPI002C401FAB|nr:DUF6804 family protein [Pedobacter sp.]HMI05733.1 DUF6804 family protein [Pedobacter sp.]